MKIWYLPLVGALMSVTAARADMASDLADHVGYTVIAAKTIEGFRDKSGKRGDSFEGCEWDRIIIFTDGKAVRCTGYGYSYSWRPRAAILSDGTTAKMIVGDTVYSISLDLR